MVNCYDWFKFSTIGWRDYGCSLFYRVWFWYPIEVDVEWYSRVRTEWKCYSVGTVQIYNHHELYDEPIVEVKYVGGVISDKEWKKIPSCFLNKLVESAYMFTTTIKDGNYHIAITVK